MSITPEDRTALDALQEASDQYDEYIELASAAGWMALVDASQPEEEVDTPEYVSAPLGLVIH